MARLTSAATLCACLLWINAAAQAETITQTVEVLGWTTTGKEAVAQVTVGASGMDDQGDPVDWYYSVLEVSDATSGQVLQRYKRGQPSGPLQKTWSDAKDAAEGDRFLQNLGLIEAVRGPVSPDGKRALVTVSTQDAQPMQALDPECPGCNQCTTTLQIWLVDGTAGQVFGLPHHQRTGAPFPPDQREQSCPALQIELYWHPNGQRAIAVYQDKIAPGVELQQQRNLDFAKDTAAWKQWPARPSDQDPRQGLQALFDDTRARLAQTDAPLIKAELLTQLGDLSLRRGDPPTARGYYNAALDFDKQNGAAWAGLATAARLDGDDRAAQAALKNALREHKRQKLSAEPLGLYYLLADDPDKAQRLFQEAVDRDGGASKTDRLLLGLRILDADLPAGLAYMENLFDGLDPQHNDIPAPLLTQTAARLTRESIHARDLDGAARYLRHLDKTNPQTQALALHTSALSGDPARVQQAIDAAGVLLERDPGHCDLYLIRGLAFSRASPPNPQAAWSHLSAANACDHTLTDARYYLADLLYTAGRLPEARDAWKAWLALAPQRRGDRALALRRDHVTRLLPRLDHKGLILLSNRCDLRGTTLSCRGVVRNTTDDPSGPADLLLSAWTRDRKRQKTLESTAQIPNVNPHTSLNFAIDLPGVTDDLDVELLLGRDPAEQNLNKTHVQ
jgi:tetratricopeptide (TPR) repeat protein